MTALETLATGFGLIEGPRVDAEDNLYFSDVPNGGVFRRAPSGQIDQIVPKRRGVGGIALHEAGGLVIGGRNVCHVLDGETRVIFEPDAGSVNDLMVDAGGGIITGTIRTDPFDTSGPRIPGEAYRIAPGGGVEQLYDDVGLTNGIGFSPDGDRLYHSDSVGQHVITHDLAWTDGRPTLSNRRAMQPFDGFMPDGLAVDEAGTIWVADFGARAVIAMSPDGDEIARIEVPARSVTSVCFGGSDRLDLYIVTADNTDDPDRKGTIFRARASVPGLPAPLARV